MKKRQYKNIQIWIYKNTHVEKYKCEICKRVCKGSIYI